MYVDDGDKYVSVWASVYVCVCVSCASGFRVCNSDSADVMLLLDTSEGGWRGITVDWPGHIPLVSSKIFLDPSLLHEVT